MNRYLFSSESVTEGHPDKVCDRISDAVLDEIISWDPNGRVACETACSHGSVIVMGEITSEADYDIEKIVKTQLREIGYDDPDAGFDIDNCEIIIRQSAQSEDIARGTNQEVGGAGDQGMMFGYACNETPDLMPLPITLANKMAYRLDLRRKDKTIPSILPDGKTQVTVEYDNGYPIKIDTVVISIQHREGTNQDELADQLIKYVITPVLDEAKSWIDNLDIDSYKLFVNPTGRFVKGGPAADTGLTGRKIIVDTYGGYGSHGGGAFSGKDPSKVDRSGAYMARYIAKNIVAAGIATRCSVQLAYAIGVKEPVSVFVDTFGTDIFDDSQSIVNAVKQVFDLTPNGIIETLDLLKPIYRNLSAYGHFGSVNGSYKTWERTDKAEQLKNLYYSGK